MINFSLHNLITFSMIGEGSLANYLRYQYENFIRVDENQDNYKTDFKVFVHPSKHLLAKTTLNANNGSYSIDKDSHYFIWANSNDSVYLDGQKSLLQQTELSFDSGFNKMKANLIIECLLRLKMIRNDIVLVHAAAVKTGNHGFLIPAWKGMGKTAACLKLIESGCDFMGDDRVWLSKSGAILAYPRYVVIKSSNAAFFPEFISNWVKLKIAVYKFLSRVSIIRYMRVFKLFKRLVIQPTYFKITELYPNVSITDNTRLTHVVYIEKSSLVSNVVVNKTSPEILAASTSQISNVEWNYPLLEIAAAHDVLFPDAPSWNSELESLMSSEKTVIHQAFLGAKSSAHTLFPVNYNSVNWKDFQHQVSQL